MKVLRDGVALWNSWIVNRYEQPDFREADLERFDLRDANFNGGILIDANLRDAAISGARCKTPLSNTHPVPSPWQIPCCNGIAYDRAPEDERPRGRTA